MTSPGPLPRSAVATVAVVHPDGLASGFVLINASDFDAARHTLWTADAEPAVHLSAPIAAAPLPRTREPESGQSTKHDISSDAGSRAERRLAEHVLQLLKNCGESSRNEIRDALHRHESSADITAALANLEAAGLAEQSRVETAGRDRETWKATR